MCLNHWINVRHLLIFVYFVQVQLKWKTQIIKSSFYLQKLLFSLQSSIKMPIISMLYISRVQAKDKQL